ncbi:MAG: hypothetical protein AAB839_02645 [Patescibacteria group bacterium]
MDIKEGAGARSDQEPVKEGWHDETAERWDGLLAFTRRIGREQSPEARDTARASGARITLYDSLTELHYSPGDQETHMFWMRTPEDNAEPTMREVEVQYKGGKLSQIHGYLTFGRGQGTDVYLKGKALADFLAEQK